MSKSVNRFKLVLQRAVAYLIDIVLLFAILAPLGFLIQRLVGLQPASGPELSITILWNFSLPAWIYFTVSDCSARGATLGKRLMGIRVTSVSANRVSFGRALLRTAVKLLPWELVHITAFALSADLNQFSLLQYIGIGLANVLWLTYLLVAIATKGHQSVQDFIAKTEVQNTE